jgi:hypothetical protein
MRTTWLLAALVLAGCKLVDQTTFAPSPAEKPAPTAAAADTDPRTPLLTIGYDTPSPSYQDVLHYAVRAAEARSAHVEYDVYALLPAGGDAAQAQNSALDVMRTIMAQGVPAARVHLGLRTEPANTPRETRVYVR